MVVLSEFAILLPVNWFTDYCAALGGTQLAVATEPVGVCWKTIGEWSTTAGFPSIRSLSARANKDGAMPSWSLASPPCQSPV